jgi:hypothetical protein
VFSLHLLVRLEALLQAAKLIDTRIVTGLLQAAEFDLRAGAAERGNGLIEAAHQRKAFGTRRQLLIAIAQLGFRLSQQIPAVLIVFIVKGVAVQDGRRFPGWPPCR